MENKKIPNLLAEGVFTEDASVDLLKKIQNALRASGAIAGMAFFYNSPQEIGPHMKDLREGLSAAYEIWKKLEEERISKS